VPERRDDSPNAPGSGLVRRRRDGDVPRGSASQAWSPDLPRPITIEDREEVADRDAAAQRSIPRRASPASDGCTVDRPDRRCRSCEYRRDSAVRSGPVPDVAGDRRSRRTGGRALRAWPPSPRVSHLQERPRVGLACAPRASALALDSPPISSTSSSVGRFRCSSPTSPARASTARPAATCSASSASPPSSSATSTRNG